MIGASLYAARVKWHGLSTFGGGLGQILPAGMRKRIVLLLAAGLLGSLSPGWSAPPAGSPPRAGLDSEPSLVGWWKLHESTGTTAKDSSPRGHDAVLEGGLTFENRSAPAPVGTALKLNGKGECLLVRGFKGVSGTRPRTLAAWIKTAAPTGEIMAWGTNEFGKMWTFGFVRSRIGVTPKGGYLYMNAETHDDVWHHVAVVVQEAETPNLHDHVALYLDGAKAIIHDIGLLDLWPIDTGSDQDVRIGRGFNGLLADVRLYERALAEEEIQSLYERGTGRGASPSKVERK